MAALKSSSILTSKLSALLHSSCLKSIEVLPGGLEEWEFIELPPDAPKPSIDFPFVFVEGNLGIPKKVLRMLYLDVVPTKWQSTSTSEVKSASIIVILFNPAHQTALNARKTLIKKGCLDSQEELVLMELISRGSPECAKQSIIWDHRRWCFVQIYGVIGPDAVAWPLANWASSEEAQFLPKITPAAVEQELLFIHHTCEIYPRNYHAWAHWHFVIDACYASIRFGVDEDRQREFLGILVTESSCLRSWAEQHVSDYSAMHQLCKIHELLNNLRSGGMPLEGQKFSEEVTPLRLVDHALSLTVDYPSHEALWMYLRVALSAVSPAERQAILDKLQLQHFPSSHFKDQLFSWYQRVVKT